MAQGEIFGFVIVDRVTGEELAKNVKEMLNIYGLHILLTVMGVMTVSPTCLGLQLCKGDWLQKTQLVL